MKKRFENFEVLRVFSMIMIIVLHSLSHGGVSEIYDLGKWQYFALNIIRAIGYLGVNLFVLISGFFLCDSFPKASKIVRLYIQLVFYGIVAAVVATFFLGNRISLNDLIKIVFPISSNSYWFASVYFILIIISPLLNLTIRSMNEKQHNICNIVLFVLFSIIPSVLFWSKPVFSEGKDIAWFATLYMIAAYIRKYDAKNLSITYAAGAITIIVLLEYVSAKVGYSGKLMYFNNNTLIAFLSLTVFIWFKNHKFGRVLNTVGRAGKYTFGVYLLSDHELLRTALWKGINLPAYKDTFISLLASIIIAVSAIMIIGCLIEYLRVQMLRILRVDNIMERIDKTIKI